jgi:hypothetical protein
LNFLSCIRGRINITAALKSHILKQPKGSSQDKSSQGLCRLYIFIRRNGTSGTVVLSLLGRPASALSLRILKVLSVFTPCSLHVRVGFSSGGSDALQDRKMNPLLNKTTQNDLNCKYKLNKLSGTLRRIV